MSVMRTFATVAFFVAAVGLSRSSNAQTGTAPQKPPQTGVCWQDAATGQPVPKENLVPNGATQDRTDPNRASTSPDTNPEGGAFTGSGNPNREQATTGTRNFVRGADGSWSDAATGQPVPNGNLVPSGAHQDRTDPDRASTSPDTNPGGGAFTSNGDPNREQ